MTAMVAVISTTDSQISHAGTCVREMRKFISSGLHKGISEATRARVESGARMMGKIITMQKISGITRNRFSCCSSCSLFVIAPSAAAIEE
jgi:hypothetical protein